MTAGEQGSCEFGGYPPLYSKFLGKTLTYSLPYFNLGDEGKFPSPET